MYFMKNQILLKIREYANLQVNFPACQYLNQQISWKEFENRTNWIASILRDEFHIVRQTPVVIYHARGLEYIEYMVAVLKCGCYYIPLEHSTPVKRVKTIYDDIDAGLILTDRIDLFSEEEYCKFAFDDWESVVPDCVKQQEIVEVYDTDLVYCIYTSGTSGKPKGVKIMYRNLINLVESFYDILYGIFDYPIQVGVLASFSFDSSVKQIYCSLFYGHTMCIAESATRLSGQKLHDFFLHYKISVCDITPSHLKLISLQKIKRISNIPYLLVGGEVLRWEQLHAYVQHTAHQPIFINLYGPTECCVDVAYKKINSEELECHKSGVVPIGKALRNTTLTIRNENMDSIEEAFKEGELIIAGKQVGAGYVNSDSEIYCELDGYSVYKTGDMAYFDENKDVVVIGRKDKQVKINGNRVELEEIQYAIESIVHCSCIVICVESESGNKLAAFISDQQFNTEEKERLVQQLYHVIPKYMVPHYYICAASLPLTENGKIDSKQLQRLFLQNVRKV